MKRKLLATVMSLAVTLSGISMPVMAEEMGGFEEKASFAESPAESVYAEPVSEESNYQEPVYEEPTWEDTYEEPILEDMQPEIVEPDEEPEAPVEIETDLDDDQPFDEIGEVLPEGEGEELFEDDLFSEDAETLEASAYPESDHPYENNIDESKSFSMSGAIGLSITFSEETETESCDYIYIYQGEDSSGTLVGCYSRTELAGKTIVVEGDTVCIRLTSDGSVTYYGYSINSIKSISEAELKEWQETVVDNGTYAGTIHWELKKNGTLRLYGKGEILYDENQSYPWMNKRQNITKIVMESGITGIGAGAFSGMSNVTSVELPDSLVAIGEQAFYGCNSLASIVIPKSVASIGNEAFQFCRQLTKIEIPNSNTMIGEQAIPSYYEMDTVVYAPIGSDADKYTRDHNIFFMPTDLEADVQNFVVDDDGFLSAYNGHAMVVNIPSTVRFIGAGVLSGRDANYNYLKYMKEVTIPETVTGMGEGVFNGCSYLENVTIPGSISVIQSNSFNNCNRLQTVTLCEGVTRVENAFNYCGKLDAINLPDSLMALSGFSGCAISELVIPNSVISLRGFGGCTGLTELEIPNSVTDLSGFDGCTGLTELTIPNSVTSLSGFGNCTGLTELTIPNSVTNLGGFNNCTGLTELTIPNSVIYLNGFVGCTGLTKLSIPDSVTRLSGFNNCTGLTELTIPNSVTDMRGFNNCTGLTSVEIPISVNIIDSSFQECTNLTEYRINYLTRVSVRSQSGYVDENGLHHVIYTFSPTLGCMTDKYGQKIPVPNVKIIGYTGSIAETYANEYGIPFESLGPCPPERYADARPEWVDNYIELSWKPVDNAKGYRIYRYESKTSEEKSFSCSVRDIKSVFTLVTETENCNFRDVSVRADRGYAYYIDPFNETGSYLDRILSDHTMGVAGFGWGLFKPDSPTQPTSTPMPTPSPTPTPIPLPDSLVHVIVLDSDSKPIPGVYLKIVDANGKLMKNEKGWAYCAEAGDDGTWDIQGLPAGNYKLETLLVPAGYLMPEPIPFTVADEKPQTVHMTVLSDPEPVKKKLKTPSISKIANTAKGVQVTWGPVADAEKYRVYRKTETSGWSRLGDATATTYTDTKAASGTTYIYTVRCVSEDGMEHTSGYDKVGTSILYLANTKVSALANIASGIKVTWGKIAGAAGYYVYRKTGSGSYAKIATIKSGTTVSYEDKETLTNGATYGYAVKAYNGKTVSAYTGMSTIRLAKVTISSCSNTGAGQITVKWNKNTKATGYQVQYVLGSTKKTITIKNNTTVSYVIKSLTKGKTYKVTVRSYKTSNGKNYYSAWSAAKSIQITR